MLILPGSGTCDACHRVDRACVVIGKAQACVFCKARRLACTVDGERILRAHTRGGSKSTSPAGGPGRPSRQRVLISTRTATPEDSDDSGDRRSDDVKTLGDVLADNRRMKAMWAHERDCRKDVQRRLKVLEGVVQRWQEEEALGKGLIKIVDPNSDGEREASGSKGKERGRIQDETQKPETREIGIQVGDGETDTENKSADMEE